MNDTARQLPATYAFVPPDLRQPRTVRPRGAVSLTVEQSERLLTYVRTVDEYLMGEAGDCITLRQHVRQTVNLLRAGDRAIVLDELRRAGLA